MRASGTPHLVRVSGDSTALERISLGSGEIREGHLQELLDKNPSILPVNQFDGSFGPLVSLGREIMGIDNLFIGPNGRLTVVETKLWRNPQATRTVLAQILDYASRLSRQTFEEFQATCQAANQSALSGGTGLYQFVTAQFPDLVPPEAEFTDRVQRDLRNGRFLLLVVGDGIREGLEHVLDALHHQSRLHFTFGLVELALYREPKSGGMLVAPSVIAHSTEVERAVVTIRGGTAEQVEIDVRSGPSEQAPKLTEQEFLESINDSRARQFGEHLFQWAREHARIEIAKGGMSAIVRLPFSTTRKGLILIRLYRTGRILVTPPRLRVALKNSGVGDEEVFRIAHALQGLYPELKIDPDKNGVCPPMQAADLLSQVNGILEIYSRAVERLEAIDPGLEATSVDDEGESEEDDNA
jgi:hypothetical protein